MTEREMYPIEMYSIKVASQMVGLSVETIRHYRTEGLVTPSGWGAGGFRLYTDEDIERLRTVKALHPLNSPAQIREALLRRKLPGPHPTRAIG